MAIKKSGKHWVVTHNKTGALMGKFTHKSVALAQNKAVHAYFSAHPKKNKLKKKSKAKKSRGKKR